MDNLETVFDAFLADANDGIKLDDIFIKFHTLEKTSLTGTYNDVPILIIKNKKELLNKLRTYIDIVLEHDNLKGTNSDIRKIIISLFSNACYEDFSNPNLFIENRINFYINDDFLENSSKEGNIVYKRNVEPILKETPYAFKAYIDGEDKYYLPTINYGISNDVCYIYNISMPINKKEKSCNDELLSLSIFTKELYNHGIGKIKVVTCLPMREKKFEFLELFTDLGCLFHNIVISSRPFEKDEYMNIKLSEFDEKFNTSFMKLL